MKCAFIFMPEAPPILFKDSASREECKIRGHEMCSYFHTRGAIVSPSVPSDLESEGAKYEDFQSDKNLFLLCKPATPRTDAVYKAVFL